MRKELLALFKQLDESDQLRVLLLAMDDWAAEVDEPTLRQRLLDMVDTPDPEEVATVARRPEAYTPKEIQQAVEGLVILDEEERVRHLAAPLVALWARHSHRTGTTVETLASVLESLSVASVMTLHRLAKHLVDTVRANTGDDTGPDTAEQPPEPAGFPPPAGTGTQPDREVAGAQPPRQLTGAPAEPGRPITPAAGSISRGQPTSSTVRSTRAPG